VVYKYPVVNDLLSQMSRTVTRQLMFTSDSGEADLRVTEPLRERLHRPVSLLRADDPVRATDAVCTPPPWARCGTNSH
jgi:hypothetical protein